MLLTTDNLRIESLKPITSAALLIADLPLTAKGISVVTQAREEAENIIKGKDDRLLIVVGPCSIHDPNSALEYGMKLSTVMQRLADELCIIMRVYFEKPRTIVGWKGLINDPNLDGSFDINKGLHLARKLLIDLADKNIPAGTEFLDTIIPQYISDTISWGAIGARTTECQIHRELASGLSMPIGFKNGTDGNIQIAVDAIRSAQHPHHFLSVSKLGVPVNVATKGNDSTHVILRGSSQDTNYDADSVAKTVALLEKNELHPYLMIDCSHGNSNKDYRLQPKVAENIAQQLQDGSQAICGVMLESNLIAGKQNLESGQPLVYGQSITDACMAWEDTIPVLENLAKAVKIRRKTKRR